ncbi:hypothetical protein PYCCODRAFT_1440845 [Trametes coccinea BRFM310]|uniref:Uncharacterized protein n=1 Tax=Trametes coccinea (strain BRFM310) TaxID=1353009 RepID=A0A1Y2I6F9_TRAC3|nr:hypothetical protein PYCCODRAFT_1440845 [Trametes coccinea BRFM310]
MPLQERLLSVLATRSRCEAKSTSYVARRTQARSLPPRKQDCVPSMDEPLEVTSMCRALPAYTVV